MMSLFHDHDDKSIAVLSSVLQQPLLAYENDDAKQLD